MTEQKYRISFEVVNPISHPQAYRGDSPCVPATEVPEEWWHRVERESYDLADVQQQYYGLRRQIGAGELIRNPQLERAVVVWEPVPDDRATCSRGAKIGESLGVRP